MRFELTPWNGDGSPTEQSLRVQLEGEGFDVFRWRDEAGSTYAPHSHPHNESLWIVEGQIVLTISGRDYRLGPGDRLMLPKGTMHTTHAGPDGVTYLIGEQH